MSVLTADELSSLTVMPSKKDGASAKASLQAAVWAKKRKEQLEKATKLRCAAAAARAD